MGKEIGWLLKEKYGGVEGEAFHADCERLRAGEPLAYLIGSIPFLGCTIYLDSRPLIPRVETEFWVEKAIAKIVKSAAAKPPRVLDLCAGSGAIGVAVAHHLPTAQVTFAELDPIHLPTIEKNLNKNTTIYGSDKYKFYESDLFNNVIGQFDYILSNPPYIDIAANTVEPSVSDHEPHLALFGGQDGLEIIERIIKEAPTYLTKGGQLWLEHEPTQTKAITKLASASGLSVSGSQDQYGVERYSVLVLQ